MTELTNEHLDVAQHLKYDSDKEQEEKKSEKSEQGPIARGSIVMENSNLPIGNQLKEAMPTHKENDSEDEATDQEDGLLN